jgi:hypothetical protein
VRRPLTEWDGGQVGKVFRNLHLWWPGDDPTKDDPTQAAIRKLQEDQDVGHIVTNLKRVLDALAVIHKQVSIGTPDITRLTAVVETLRGAHVTFTAEDVLKFLPFRYRLKLYNHVILCYASLCRTFLELRHTRNHAYDCDVDGLELCGVDPMYLRDVQGVF